MIECKRNSMNINSMQFNCLAEMMDRMLYKKKLIEF